MALQEFIEIGEYPSESELWDIPIAIYDDEGEVRYYEFRIVDGEEQTLGAIAGNAREDKGGPIAFVFEMEGYADELSELYNSGVLSEDDIPRLVDNDYPDAYAVASAGVTRSGRVSLDDVVDPSTGEPIDELNVPLELEGGIAAYPDLLNAEQIAAARDGLENYKAEIAELWKAAKVNKGSLHNLVFRGTQKKKPRTSVDSSRIAKAEEYGRKSNGG